jgi:hypothetical protein
LIRPGRRDHHQLPGLGSLTGALVLAEIGDDRSRFTNARSVKAYAGSAPATRASGKSFTVTHRRDKNQRLAVVGYVWAFAALTASPGARAHYDRRKITHDRVIGGLHTRKRYIEQIAFPDHPHRLNQSGSLTRVSDGCALVAVSPGAVHRLALVVTTSFLFCKPPDLIATSDLTGAAPDFRRARDVVSVGWGPADPASRWCADHHTTNGSAV